MRLGAGGKNVSEKLLGESLPLAKSVQLLDEYTYRA